MDKPSLKRSWEGRHVVCACVYKVEGVKRATFSLLFSSFFPFAKARLQKRTTACFLEGGGGVVPSDHT